MFSQHNCKCTQLYTSITAPIDKAGSYNSYENSSSTYTRPVIK